MIPTACHSGKGQTLKTVRSVVARSLVGGMEGGMSAVYGIFRAMELFCMTL